MASTGPDNSFSRISLIKARLRTEGDAPEEPSPPAAPAPPSSAAMTRQPPPAGQYVSSMPFRSAAPPPDADDDTDPSGFRPAPLQTAAQRPRPPVQKAAPAGPLQKAPPQVQKSSAAPPLQKAAPSPAGPQNPLQKASPPNPNPLQKASGSSAAPTNPLQKAPATQNPLQKATPPPPAGQSPLQKPPSAIQKAAPQGTPAPRRDSIDPDASGETPASPVILRPRAVPPSPAVRANNIAGLVSRALGSNVGDSVMPALHDLAILAKGGETPPQPPPPPAEAPPRFTQVDAPSRPAEPPRAAGPEASRFSAPPTQRMQPATPRFGSPTTRLAGASVEAFMEGKTDGASLKERELAMALRNLQNAGWTFLTLRSGQTDGTPTEAAGVYRFLLDDKRSSYDRVRLIDPKARTFTVSGADQVSSLDYFHGTGAPTSLRNPMLAKKLQSVAASGLVPEGDDPTTPGTWGAYVALMRGGHASLQIEGVVFGEIRGTQLADVDAATRPLTPLLSVHRDTLVPEAQAGRLHLETLGTALQTLHYEVPDVILGDRVQAFLRIAAAIRGGPHRPADLAALTYAAAQAYESILELDVGGDAYWEAVATMETLLRVVPADEAAEPLHFLYRESARNSPFAQARQEREEVFRRVLACGHAPHAAIEITQHVVARAWDEDLETRVQLFEALTELAAEQPGYAHVMRDFDVVLRYRSVQETLEDAARPFLAIFEALAGRGCAEETSATWAFLHEGVRYGYLEAADGGLHDLADRFVSLFTQVGNVQEARQRLMHYT